MFCQIYSETPAMDSFFCKCCRSWVWRNFSEHLFCKTSVSNYLCLSAIRLKGESQNGCFRNKARQIFRKTNISYTLVCTRKCAYQGVRNVIFRKIWRALFLETPILRFTHLSYYRRVREPSIRILPCLASVYC